MYGVGVGVTGRRAQAGSRVEVRQAQREQRQLRVLRHESHAHRLRGSSGAEKLIAAPSLSI